MLGLGLILLNACANAPTAASAPLAGTWTNSLGTVFMLKTDGTFEVQRKGHSQPIPGTYTINNDTITIQGTPGTGPKGCDGAGVYKFARHEGNLTFTLVSDTCADRKKNLSRPWHAK